MERLGQRGPQHTEGKITGGKWKSWKFFWSSEYPEATAIQPINIQLSGGSVWYMHDMEPCPSHDWICTLLGINVFMREPKRVLNSSRVQVPSTAVLLDGPIPPFILMDT
jgi:hypothetical protein